MKEQQLLQESLPQQLADKTDRNILPQANIIFQSLEHAKKNIYPFQMKSKINMEMTSKQQSYSIQSDKTTTFKPFYPSIKQHFKSFHLIYDKFNNNMDDDLFNMNIYPISKLKNLKNNDYVINKQVNKCYQKYSQNLLIFDSRFESGNLSLASYIQQTDTYYLLLHNDVNTSGYTNWFYFKIRNQSKGLYKFAILNYGKAGWQHNQGVKICVQKKGKVWERGCNNIYCQSNRGIFKKGTLLNFNTLYFQYQFEEDNQQVYFAYSVPYTYNDLCCFLDDIQSKNSLYFHRKIAGLSIAGNKLELISITNFKLTNKNNVPSIIFMARAHPGETVSSWIMHYLIKFLLSSDPVAQTLRNNFVFKLFPMLNPDGVIHGNYRCSLSGRDLNRRWKQPNKQLYPQVYYVKNLILEIYKKRGIKLFVDLHGHTQKKKFFAYGCNDKVQPHRCRLYPYLVSKFTDNFQFRFCNFNMDRSKIGTARISMFQQLKIPYIYTIESSQFGTFDGHHSLSVFQKVGKALAQSTRILFRLKIMPIFHKQIKNIENQIQQQQNINFENIENQLISDANLLKIGNEKDAGSDSQPSVDNIDFDKLKKLNERKSLKVNSYIIKPKAPIKDYKKQFNSFEKIEKNQTTLVRPKTTENRNLRNTSKIQTHSLQKPMASPSQGFMKSKMNRPELRKNNLMKSQRKNPSYRQTQTVNFINLSLSINQDLKGTRQKSCKLSLVPLSQGFQDDQTHHKLKVISRNFYIFRRRK